jgi:hypothetical protein
MNQIRPLAIDLFCGLGGWAEGFLSEGWDVIGFDVERHDYGTGGYPGQLVLQDVTTLHGSQFRNADVIVASPPCQAYSYRAMPWKQSKALTPEEVGLPEPSWWRLPEYKPLDARKDGDAPCMTLQDMAEWAIWRRKHLKAPPDNTLFETCFRLQREASEAAGRYIPLIVENVRGAEKWVGAARWKFGSYYLWGDLPALMPIPTLRQAMKVGDCGWRRDGKGNTNRCFQGAAVDAMKSTGTKQGGEWWHDPESLTHKYSSRSPGRKAASAAIAKIPFPLAQHIARVFKPTFHVEHPVSGL